MAYRAYIIPFMKIFITILLWLFPLYGQTLVSAPTFSAQTGYYTIRGKIVDAATQMPIPNATIYTANKGAITQSNADGIYELKLQDPQRDDLIVFSAYGYLRDTVSVATLTRHPNIKLNEGPILLRQVTVTAYTPQTVIQKAISLIPENYQSDTTVCTFFYRNWKMANDSLYLFYENVFESLRTGYGKDKQKRINLSESRKSTHSNYNTLLRSRLLICDSVYLSHLLLDKASIREHLSYRDNELILDLIELPIAAYIFNRKYRKRFSYSMEELNDGEHDYYLITMKGMEQTWILTINQDDFAITDIVMDMDTGTFEYPTGKLYRLDNPYSSRTVHNGHREIRYRKIIDKYTLVSDIWYSDITYICHQEGIWRQSPEVQNFKGNKTLVLTNLSKGDHTFLESTDILTPKETSYTELHTQKEAYDESYWEQLNIVPLENTIEMQVNTKLHINKTPF